LGFGNGLALVAFAVAAFEAHVTPPDVDLLYILWEQLLLYFSGGDHSDSATSMKFVAILCQFIDDGFSINPGTG
jgi:hypothetical protein